MISARRKKNPGKLPGLARPILPSESPRQAWIDFLQDCLPFLRRPPHLQQAYRRIGRRLAEAPLHRQVVPRGSASGFADTVPGSAAGAEALEVPTPPGPPPLADAGPARAAAESPARPISARDAPAAD
ncbi:hypothetical protein [Piscinibacter sakaiensis]|uniref:Uncharacterized protein n=1 Tax=Piscinibacter sakaiensis TaxID=1547922 RepID=A0A0K8P1P1_PISS1|nr:hypothetical protein [Piscinibacter sakaiensis]GAP36551.1 hypothetical protein ISF6_2391 [Piscinibacter sakaiensis]